MHTSAEEFETSYSLERRTRRTLAAPIYRYREQDQEYAIPLTITAIADLGEEHRGPMADALAKAASSHELTIAMLCRPEDLPQTRDAILDHEGDPEHPDNETSAAEAAACLACMDPGRTSPQVSVLIGHHLTQRYGKEPIAGAAAAILQKLKVYRSLRDRKHPTP